MVFGGGCGPGSGIDKIKTSPKMRFGDFGDLGGIMELMKTFFFSGVN